MDTNLTRAQKREAGMIRVELWIPKRLAKLLKDSAAEGHRGLAAEVLKRTAESFR